MELKFVLLFSFMAGFLGLLVIPFWASKFGKGLTGKGILLSGLFSFIGTFLILPILPEEGLAVFGCIGLGIVLITVIIHQIFG